MHIHFPYYSSFHHVPVWFILEGCWLIRVCCVCVRVCERSHMHVHVHTCTLNKQINMKTSPENRWHSELGSHAGTQPSPSGGNLGCSWDMSFPGVPSSLSATPMTMWDPSWFLLLHSRSRHGCSRPGTGCGQSCHWCLAAWGWAEHWPVTLGLNKQNIFFIISVLCLFSTTNWVPIRLLDLKVIR